MDAHFMKLLMIVITGHPSIPIVEHKDDQESEFLPFSVRRPRVSESKINYIWISW